MVLLNRKRKADFVDEINETTEFKQSGEYVQYKNVNKESPEALPSPLRMIFFSVLEEKEAFLKNVE